MSASVDFNLGLKCQSDFGEVRMAVKNMNLQEGETVARQKTEALNGTLEGEYEPNLFVSHHLEEVEPVYWAYTFDNERPAFDHNCQHTHSWSFAMQLPVGVSTAVFHLGHIRVSSLSVNHSIFIASVSMFMVTSSPTSPLATA